MGRCGIGDVSENLVKAFFSIRATVYVLWWVKSYIRETKFVGKSVIKKALYFCLINFSDFASKFSKNESWL